MCVFGILENAAVFSQSERYMPLEIQSKKITGVLSILQVLLVADDVEVRRLVLSANIVTEKVAVLNSARTMAAVMDNFQVGWVREGGKLINFPVVDIHLFL
jgi:hypothetical protein